MQLNRAKRRAHQEIWRSMPDPFAANCQGGGRIRRDMPAAVIWLEDCCGGAKCRRPGVGLPSRIAPPRHSGPGRNNQIGAGRAVPASRCRGCRDTSTRNSPLMRLFFIGTSAFGPQRRRDWLSVGPLGRTRALSSSIHAGCGHRDGGRYQRPARRPFRSWRPRSLAKLALADRTCEAHSLDVSQRLLT